jgi:hypothetical protein
MGKIKPTIFERGGSIFLVAPVAPLKPGEEEIDHFAFAEQLKKTAPNENLLWLRGNYVEADNANRNGHVWTADELSIKSLTPMFMPVTVMHDPRTAVGLIAEAGLKVPDRDGVPRARIEAAMALWQHRWPEVCEEAMLNYNAGTLMQSMECRSPWYSCAECGESFPKLLDGAERKNWCEHMKASDGHGARILGDVTFTGTGLIFGTRGAEGAYDEAHLDVFQDEVAEFHQKAQRDTRPARRRRTSMDPIEISREEYAELQKRPTPEELAAEKKRADDAETAKAEAEQKAEEKETEAQREKDRAETAEKKVTEAEEDKAKDDLAKERLGKLGSTFLAKLGEFTRGRVNDQARTLSEEDWEARMKELEESTETARDEGGADEGASANGNGGGDGGGKKPGEFSREETARAHVGKGGGASETHDGGEPSPEQRSSVMRGLMPSKSTAASE